MKRIAIVLAASALIAAVAFAQPFWAKGDMYCAPGCWNLDAGNLLTDNFDGTYSGSVTTDQAAGRHEFKIADSLWTMSWPGSNQWTHTTGSGGVVLFSLDRNVQGDGWFPDQDIVWNDHYVPNVGSETWEVIGNTAEIGNWGAGVLANDIGGGICEVIVAFAVAGTYEYKWRANASWDDQVAGGDGYASAGGNIFVTTTNDGDLVTFKLNKNTGRHTHTVTAATGTDETSWGHMKSLFR